MGEIHKKLARTVIAVTSVAALSLSGTLAASGHGSSGHGKDGAGLKPLVEDLNGPRGLDVGPGGRVVFAEADGTFSEFKKRGKRGGSVTELGSVPATGLAPAVAVKGRGKVFVLTTAGEPGTGAATLYRWNPGRGTRAVADIAAYQETDPDPFDIEDFPEDSNPYGVAALPDGSALVADAGGNDLLRVFPDGRIVTVARMKPREVEVPEGLPDEFDGEPLPPAGAIIPSESVPTSVTIGKDGYYYVGELRGFPSTPGTSQIWRIAPDSVDAVCDPEAPDTGDCRRFADGFTSVVDLAAGRDGSLYVLELVAAGWLQWELDLVPPTGALYRVPRGGGSPVELVPGELTLPGGVAVGKKGTVYVAGPIFGPGTVSAIR